MARICLESWAPDYGAAYEPDEELAARPESIDTTVEMAQWVPVDGVDDSVERIAFVDGVRRIDARIAVDDPELGPIPGLCASIGVGTVVWDRVASSSRIDLEQVTRIAVIGEGRPEQIPAISPEIVYRTEPVPGRNPEQLIKHLHSWMRRLEGEVATTIAAEDCFVVVDGPLNDLSARPQVGYVKSHRASYLPPELNKVVGLLEPSQRTPLFAMKAFQRYSWYLRLARIPGGHSWVGVVRCEAPGSLPLADVRMLADRTAAVLPLLASEPHIDPRAPQNLVPVGALERQLRRRLGDHGLVVRALRAALAEEAA